MLVLRRGMRLAARSETRAATGAVGFSVGFAASGVPLKRAPLAVFGVGVLDADPPGGLAAFVLAPSVVLGQWGVVTVEAIRLLRRGRVLVGELVGESAVAVVDFGFHRRVVAELLGDAFGADCGLVMHSARAFGPGRPSTSPMMGRCASPTRRSTRPSTSRDAAG